MNLNRQWKWDRDLHALDARRVDRPADGWGETIWGVLMIALAGVSVLVALWLLGG